MVRCLAAAVVAAIVLCPAVSVADAPISLTAPLDGAVLVPGQTVTISWEPSQAWSGEGFRPRHEEASDADVPIEEWEAFLSIDGGSTYPYRVTPHLDADVGTFHFAVPEVVSEDVRILVRMGNERREVGFEMPQRFAISAPGPLLVLSRASRRDWRTTEYGGEAARPGDAGVRTWVEGDRRGRALRVRTVEHTHGVRGRSIESGTFHLLALLAPQHQPVGSAKEAGRVRQLETSSSSADPALAPASRVASILLLIQRSNR